MLLLSGILSIPGFSNEINFTAGSNGYTHSAVQFQVLSTGPVTFLEIGGPAVIDPQDGCAAEDSSIAFYGCAVDFRMASEIAGFLGIALSYSYSLFGNTSNGYWVSCNGYIDENARSGFCRTSMEAGTYSVDLSLTIQERPGFNGVVVGTPSASMLLTISGDVARLTGDTNETPEPGALLLVPAGLLLLTGRRRLKVEP